MKTKLLGVMITGILILTACAAPTPTEPDAASVNTMVAQTLSALSTTMAQSQQATPVFPTASSPTAPIFPTMTYTSTSLPTATVASPTATPNLASCNKATFIQDVSIADRTSFNAGTSFTKIWRLANSGTCSWDSGYRAVFVNGDAMGAPASVSLNKTVAPGDYVDVSVTMTAPSAAREYAGYWMLQSPSGYLFGIGLDGTGKFYVDIKVNAGTPTVTPTPGTGTPTATLAYFAVRSVTITASPATYSGTCPTNINVTGSLTVNKAGTVRYHFVRSDGSTSDVKTLTFTAGGSQTISDSYQASASGYDSVYIDDPNHQLFGSAAYTLTCAAPTATSTSTPTSTPTDTPTPTPTDTDTPVPTST